jgi:hypothetical protein
MIKVEVGASLALLTMRLDELTTVCSTEESSSEKHSKTQLDQYKPGLKIAP